MLADLRALPGVYAEKIQQRSIRGTPDILACVRGWFVALELKVGAGRTDPLQDHVLAMVRKASGQAYVVTPENWQEVLSALAQLPPRAAA